MPAKFSWILIALASVIVFSWAVYRDLQSERQYASDLRNRVVGARLQEDGRSPYFYKWQSSDHLRYYDPNNFDSLRVSNITASPFFHYLMYPIADLPQKKASEYWFAAEYAMLIITTLLAFSLANGTKQRQLVIMTACAFVLTEAWRVHMGAGQNYICIPFIAMLFYYCFNRETLRMAFLAGVCAALLVLVRVNTFLFFIPFLILLKQKSRFFIAILLLPVLIAAIWVITSDQQRSLWTDYKKGIVEQIKLHQDQSPDKQFNQPNPGYTSWEGITTDTTQVVSLRPLLAFSENGNVFVLIQLVLHKKISTKLLMILSACAVILVLTIFYARQKNVDTTLPTVAVAGFCLYMISDLFSPIHRLQYYAVQWLFPLLVSAATYYPAKKSFYLLLGLGLLLNILNIEWMPMEHTLGEYIMLAALIMLSLRRETKFQ